MQFIHPLEKQGCLEAFKNPFFYLTTALFMGWVYASFGITATAMASLVFALFLILMSFVDLKHMILPDVLVIPCLLIGLIVAPYNGLSYIEAAMGGAIGFALFYGIHIGYYKLRGYHGLGFGDVKLLAMLAVWTGALQIPLILILASFTAIFAFAMRKLVYGTSGDTPLPFGPFLAAGGWLCYLYAGELWYAFFKFRENLVMLIIGN